MELKVRIKKRRIDYSFGNIIAWLLSLAYFFHGYEKAIFGEQSNVYCQLLKNGCLIVIALIGVLKLFNSSSKKYIFLNQLKCISIVIVSIFIIGFALSMIHGIFPTTTITALIRIIYPVFIAFSVLNYSNSRQIESMFDRILIFSLICFILEIGINNINSANIQRISFIKSYSPFESAYFGGTALSLFFFYFYKNRMSLKCFLSLLFVFGTFKRLSIVYCIALIIISVFMKDNRLNSKMKKTTMNIIKVSFIVVTFIYYNMILNGALIERYTGLDAESFTMGRSVFLKALLNSDYVSYGFSSIQNYLGYSLEMELISILIEVGIIGLIIFVWKFWDMTENNIYCSIIMFQAFINFLTSHSLGNPYSWIIRYIIIGYVLYKNTSIINFHSIKKKIVWNNRR